MSHAKKQHRADFKNCHYSYRFNVCLLFNNNAKNMRGLINMILFFFFMCLIIWASCQEEPKQTPVINTAYYNAYKVVFNDLRDGFIPCEDVGVLAQFIGKDGDTLRYYYKKQHREGTVYDIYSSHGIITGVGGQGSVDALAILLDSNRVIVYRDAFEARDTMTMKSQIKRYSFGGGCIVTTEIK